jgi:hypothetical protein
VSGREASPDEEELDAVESNAVLAVFPIESKLQELGDFFDQQPQLLDHKRLPQIIQPLQFLDIRRSLCIGGDEDGAKHDKILEVNEFVFY